LSRKPTVVVGTSQYILKRHLAAGFFAGADNKYVIPNAYKNVGQNAQKTSRSKLQFGFLGRISPEKGVENMLDALSTHKDLDIDLHIGGQGPLSYVSKLKRKYGARFQFCGFVDPSDFFNKIDVLIVPSLWNEPFGRIIIEAFCYGVPVIAAKRGGIPELIDEGETGFTYDPDVQDSLIQVIIRILNEKGNIMKMKQNCLTQSSRYSPDIMAEEYINLYEKMLSWK